MSTSKEPDFSNALCARLLRQRKLFRHNTLFRHACDTVRSAPLYAHWQRALTYFRRLRLVAILLRVLALVLTVLEASALVLLTTALLLLLLPPLILLSLGILLTLLIESPAKNRLLGRQTMGKQIYVLFLPTNESRFFCANARDLASRENCAVILVSPFWLSARGLYRGPFFCTVREEEKNIYLVRRYYFFALKRCVLSQRDTAFLY